MSPPRHRRKRDRSSPANRLGPPAIYWGSPEAEGCQGWVYVLVSPEGPIKIGFTTKPNTRFKAGDLHRYGPPTVVAMLPGTRQAEKSCHRFLGRLLIRSEWFRNTPKVRRVVVELQKFARAEWTADACIAHVRGEERERKEMFRSILRDVLAERDGGVSAPLPHPSRGGRT